METSLVAGRADPGKENAEALATPTLSTRGGKAKRLVEEHHQSPQ